SLPNKPNRSPDSLAGCWVVLGKDPTHETPENTAFLALNGHLLGCWVTSAAQITKSPSYIPNSATRPRQLAHCSSRWFVALLQQIASPGWPSCTWPRGTPSDAG